MQQLDLYINQIIIFLNLNQFEFQVEGLEHDDYQTALTEVKQEMENAIQNRMSSLDKFKSLQQRRRRMSIVAPINHKEVALDFEERIAICKLIDFFLLLKIIYIDLVDSDFRNGIFKLTAMLIHNVDNSGQIILFGNCNKTKLTIKFR